MKRPRGGSLWLVLTPDELVARLATLVPPPRVHAVRYHGVFAANSKVRRRIVPQPGFPPPPEQPETNGAAPLPESRRERPNRGSAAGPARSYHVPWADLLKKVFAIDVLACPDCGGRLKLIAFITEAATVARRILDHLGLDSQGPSRCWNEPPFGSRHPVEGWRSR